VFVLVKDGKGDGLRFGGALRRGRDDDLHRLALLEPPAGKGRLPVDGDQLVVDQLLDGGPAQFQVLAGQEDVKALSRALGRDAERSGFRGPSLPLLGPADARARGRPGTGGNLSLHPVPRTVATIRSPAA